MGVTIARIDAIPVLYPVAGNFKFFENAGGRPRGRPAVLVKITASDGTAGWGECVPSPRWSYETLETVLSTIRRYLAPELIGQALSEVEALHRRMNAAIAPSFSTGQPICKAGIDLALFDLSGRLERKTASERWGRNDRSAIELSWTLNPASLEAVEQDLEEAVRRGYRHFNVKVGPDPAYDIELVARIRRLAPSAEMWVDANGGYSESDALAVAPRFADMGVAYFEQPCPANRLSSFARLKQQGALPILMDEGLVSAVEMEQFHQFGLLDGATIKVSRVGGLGEARRQIEYLQRHGLIFVGSGLTDPDVSLSASVALFAAYGLQTPAALNGPQFLTKSVLREPLSVTGGRIAVPAGDGLGIDVDLAAVEALRLPDL